MFRTEATRDGGRQVPLSEKEKSFRKTEEEIDAKKQQSVEYIDKRLADYGSVGDQLDMQYFDLVNGTSKWQEYIADIKSRNPKPT